MDRKQQVWIIILMLWLPLFPFCKTHSMFLILISAATGLAIENRSGFSRSEIFIANRPFLYFIRDTETKVILFSGRIENLKSKPTYDKNGASHLTMSYAILAAMLIFWSFTSWFWSAQQTKKQQQKQTSLIVWPFHWNFR